ncbi:hypothetical protein REPUB_Repub05bG0010800 [Reevesia pubescens]
MKTNDIIFSQRPHVLGAQVLTYNSKAIIYTPYGNYWNQMRKLCSNELFSANRVQSFQSIREEEVSDFIKSIALNEGSPINLTEKFFSLSYNIMARAAFGKKSKNQEEFINIMLETVKAESGFCLSDMYPSSKVLKKISGMRIKLEKIHQAADRVHENIVNEHKEKRNKLIEAAGNEQIDLVDVLLKLQQQGDLEFRLANDNIKAIIQDIFGAGSEKSAATVEWAMSEILKNPELLKKAQNEVRRLFGENGKVNEEKIHELKFLRSIVKETLRLHPPVALNIRECRENCVINGYNIPYKTQVLINAWAVQSDPCYWKEAEKFYPERFLDDNSIDFRGTNFEYIPFGAGKRICPAISFALPGIELPLANLLYYFHWKVPNEMKYKDLEINESFGVTARRQNDLFVIPIPYYIV